MHKHMRIFGSAPALVIGGVNPAPCEEWVCRRGLLGLSLRPKSDSRLVSKMNRVTNQPFLWPSELFDTGEGFRFWTCVRTRPRWEKKFAVWLEGQRKAHFLPVFNRTTVSCRKRRTTEIPLFPGYVLVLGNHSKRTFARSDCVVRVLKPSCEMEARNLDRQIGEVWQGLKSGLPLMPVQDFAPGQRVEVLAGPLEGAMGRFVRNGRHGTLILSVEMLGVGVSVELTPDCRVESIDGPEPARR